MFVGIWAATKKVSERMTGFVLLSLDSASPFIVLSGFVTRLVSEAWHVGAEARGVAPIIRMCGS